MPCGPPGSSEANRGLGSEGAGGGCAGELGSWVEGGGAKDLHPIGFVEEVVDEGLDPEALAALLWCRRSTPRHCGVSRRGGGCSIYLIT